MQSKCQRSQDANGDGWQAAVGSEPDEHVAVNMVVGSVLRFYALDTTSLDPEHLFQLAVVPAKRDEEAAEGIVGQVNVLDEVAGVVILFGWATVGCHLDFIW